MRHVGVRNYKSSPTLSTSDGDPRHRRNLEANRTLPGLSDVNVLPCHLTGVNEVLYKRAEYLYLRRASEIWPETHAPGLSVLHEYEKGIYQSHNL